MAMGNKASPKNVVAGRNFYGSVRIENTSKEQEPLRRSVDLGEKHLHQIETGSDIFESGTFGME